MTHTGYSLSAYWLVSLAERQGSSQKIGVAHETEAGSCQTLTLHTVCATIISFPNRPGQGTRRQLVTSYSTTLILSLIVGVYFQFLSNSHECVLRVNSVTVGLWDPNLLSRLYSNRLTGNTKSIDGWEQKSEMKIFIRASNYYHPKTQTLHM